MWDAGPRASASQVHQHMQISITADRYFSRAEHARQSALRYEQRFPGANFWSDVAEVHERLGLGFRLGSAILLSHVCPIKERELIVIGPSATAPEFGELLAIGLMSLRDDIGTRAFSLAVTFEAIPDFSGWPINYPAIARVVDRGSPIDLRSDVGAMEFYGANNVGADPFQIAPFLRDRVRDRKAGNV
jgi:hypothetical protein